MVDRVWGRSCGMDAKQKHSSEAECTIFFSELLRFKNSDCASAGDARTKSGDRMCRLAVRCCVSGWGAQFTVEMIIALIAVIMTIRASTG